MKIILIFNLVLSVFLFNSCKKASGYGGNSAIKGKLEVKHYNENFTIVKSTEPAADVYVYIVFDGKSGYGDRVKTNFDGSFEFTHLAKGKYTIYTYSSEPNNINSSGFIPVQVDVTIAKNRELVDAGTLTLSDNKAVGFSILNGKIKEIDTGNGNISYYKGNQKVFLIYDNQVNFSSSIYTNYNGEYQFTNLPVGHYTVYTYSKDVYNQHAGSSYAVIKEMDISTNNETQNVPDIIIYK